MAADGVGSGEVALLARLLALLDEGFDFRVKSLFFGVLAEHAHDRVKARQEIKRDGSVRSAQFELVHLAHHVEQRCKRGRGVEIVGEGFLESLTAAFERSRHCRVVVRRVRLPESDAKVLEPPDGFPGCLHAVEREVQRLAVVRAHQHVAHGHGVASLLNQVAQGKEVAERLGHLLPVHEQEARVHPVLDERAPAGCALGLRDLAIVVRKDVILPAGVDVELLAEVAHGHGRALDVPAWKAAAPRAVPLHDVLRILLPEREVVRAALFRINLDARAGVELFQGIAAQPAVVGE